MAEGYGKRNSPSNGGRVPREPPPQGDCQYARSLFPEGSIETKIVFFKGHLPELPSYIDDLSSDSDEVAKAAYRYTHYVSSL